MKNKDDKRKQEQMRIDAERQAQAFQQQLQLAQAQTQAQAQTVPTPTPASPIEQAVSAETLGFLNAVNAKDGSFDVTKTPGMSPFLSLYDTAAQARDQDRAGTGAMQLGAQGANPNLVAAIAAVNQNRRQERAAGGLTNAFNLRNAQARGNEVPFLLGQEQQRYQNAQRRSENAMNNTMGLTSLLGGMSQNSQSAYNNFQVRPGWGATLLSQALSGALRGGR